ncbi:MAG: hypothetical protein JWP97_1885 [Labilithrix sp.]|nr:hypothetical protein [Labilithrix sp.]
MKHLSVLLLLPLLASCARSADRAPMPGDSVEPDGAVSLATPRLVTTPQPPRSPEAPLSALESRLYPAELVMENKQRLALTSAQEQQITKELGTFQAELVKLQWELQSRKDALVGVLGASKVDETSARTAAEALMVKENAIKAAHLAMLVRIKNVLTAAQQAQLDAVRTEARCAGGTDAGRD